MKFKAKPVKVEQDNDLDMRSKLHHHLPDNDSDLELTKLPSPIRELDLLVAERTFPIFHCRKRGRGQRRGWKSREQLKANSQLQHVQQKVLKS